MNAFEMVKEIKIGWNVGDTLDAIDASIPMEADPEVFETAWGNPVITQELIDTVIGKGFNLIRFPVSWKDHTGPAPDYKIVDSWMNRVQEVVDYAYKRGIRVILNLHHEDWNYPYYENQQAAEDRMRKIWVQIANRFAAYDDHLIFEAQNEPRKVDTEWEWNGGDKEGWDVVNATNRVFVDTIRSAGGNNTTRFLMIPGYGANSSVGIKHVDLPENDDRIIVSVHCYEPYDFALNIQGRKEWNHDTQKIDTLMQVLTDLYISKNIPVIIGEFGAMNKDNEEDRAAWVDYYVTAARKTKVPCVWWDNARFEGDCEKFGLFNRKTGECTYPLVLESMLQAAGVEK